MSVTAEPHAPPSSPQPEPRVSYRFLVSPRWLLFHVIVIAGVVLMVNLGFWQLDRLDQRQEFNAEVEARADIPAVTLDELLAEPDFDPDTAEWRTVTVSGTWIPDQVVVFNRSQGGLPGENVVTALQTDGGDVVLVNRGFIPLVADVPAAPPGDIALLGRARPSQERRTGELTDATDGPLTEVRRIEIDRLAPQFGGEIAPIYLDLIEVDPAAETDPTPVPPPELDEGPHLSYAVQWFIFAACVVVGWVLAVNRSIRTRKRELTRSPRGEAATGSVPRGGGAATTAPLETDRPSPN